MVLPFFIMANKTYSEKLIVVKTIFELNKNKK